jgi:GTP cyclohydrolase I
MGIGGIMYQEYQTKLEEIQKIDVLIALRVKALGQLQQSYEALVNRSVLQERLKLQNELLKRDLQAIDVPVVEQADSVKGAARGQRKAKSGK